MKPGHSKGSCKDLKCTCLGHTAGLSHPFSMLAKVGSVPVVHGSALVQRGETQSLATATVTSMSDSAEGSSPLVVHFTAPPFASNEVGTCLHQPAPHTAAGCLMHKACRRWQLTRGRAAHLPSRMPRRGPWLVLQLSLLLSCSVCTFLLPGTLYIQYGGPASCCR